MSADSPFVLARVTVDAVDRPSPSFVRISFGGPALADLGTPGRVLDQRIKLIFPAASGELPDLSDAGSEWYQAWLAIPEESRGSMRTYSIRELAVGEAGTTTTVVVDFVLHLDPESSGPASQWAAGARPGDALLLLGPRRGRVDGGGIEYSPGSARTVLLAGDETAAPAIARILEDADRDLRGTAFIEVPHADDILPIAAPPGVDVRWLPRTGRDHGAALLPAVLEYVGAESAPALADAESDDLLWETPTYSGLGEGLPDPRDPADNYFWIAGESGVVTTLRRHLVNELGVDRAQVAFMGYWRKGVAMRG
jgi:NADPH-dependent ferric siderophore reductase